MTAGEVGPGRRSSSRFAAWRGRRGEGCPARTATGASPPKIDAGSATENGIVAHLGDRTAGRTSPLGPIGVDGVPQPGRLIEVAARGVPTLVRVSAVAWQRSPEPGWAAFGDAVEGAFGSAAVHQAGGLTHLTGGACNRVALDDPGFIDATARLVASTGHGVPPGAGTPPGDVGEELDAVGGINAMYTAAKIAVACNGPDAEAGIDRAFHGVEPWPSG